MRGDYEMLPRKMKHLPANEQHSALRLANRNMVPEEEPLLWSMLEPEQTQALRHLTLRQRVYVLAEALIIRLIIERLSS